MKNVLFGKSLRVFIVFLVCINLCVFIQFAFSRKIKTENYKQNSFGKISDDYEADEFEILVLINAERTRRGLNQLIADDDVREIARKYSEKMAKENFFSHYDSDGKSVLERAKAARLKRWSKIGENLFSVENLADFDDFAVRNWMKSPAHRENILDKDWTTTGIGIAESKDGEIFITQVFIKR